MKLAIIRVRGLWGIKPKIKNTMEKLNLTKVNHCVIVDDSPTYLGMLKICKDYVAYGPISDTMIEKVITKRGRKPGNKKVDIEDISGFVEKFIQGKADIKHLGIKPVFRLTPPKKGYKSIKQAYPRGALGKWPNIDELLNKMI
ncbi:50S ribosomal protein L30 [Candidatus Micrarchaeota archaeon]|jgi:large subunit ribosomal protein L30|nr:50S ribosomal protein L30 [Candidatus Micrarchaeota archaeon]